MNPRSAALGSNNKDQGVIQPTLMHINPGFEAGRGTDVRSLTRKQWPPCSAWTLRIVFYQVDIYDVPVNVVF